jgi:hypothetical protein
MLVAESTKSSTHNHASKLMAADPELLGVVNLYQALAGFRNLSSFIRTQPLSTDFGLAIVGAYESAPNVVDSDSPCPHYEAFKTEIVQQFQHLLASGFCFFPHLTSGQPYTDSAQMRQRVLAERRLSFFLGGSFPEHYPLAQLSGQFVAGREATFNDLFRCVHDIVGHVLYGNGFGLIGEMTAARVHAQTFSESAQAALFTETVGQTLWFHFGPHAELPIAKRPYAIQKGVILPVHLRRFE